MPSITLHRASALGDVIFPSEKDVASPSGVPLTLDSSLYSHKVKIKYDVSPQIFSIFLDNSQVQIKNDENKPERLELKNITSLTLKPKPNNWFSLATDTSTYWLQKMTDGSCFAYTKEPLSFDNKVNSDCIEGGVICFKNIVTAQISLSKTVKALSPLTVSLGSQNSVHYSLEKLESHFPYQISLGRIDQYAHSLLLINKRRVGFEQQRDCEFIGYQSDADLSFDSIEESIISVKQKKIAHEGHIVVVPIGKHFRVAPPFSTERINNYCNLARSEQEKEEAKQRLVAHAYDNPCYE